MTQQNEECRATRVHLSICRFGVHEDRSSGSPRRPRIPHPQLTPSEAVQLLNTLGDSS